MVMQFMYTALVFGSAFVLSSLIGGGIAKILVSRSIINSKDSRETTILYHIREMVYATKEQVAFSAGALSAVVYVASGQAGAAYFATVVLTGLLWLLTVTLVYPKKVITNFKQAKKEESDSSAEPEDDKLIEHAQ